MHCLLARLRVARPQGGWKEISLINFAHHFLRVNLWAGSCFFLFNYPVYLQLFLYKAFSGKFRSASSTVGSVSPFTISVRRSANSLRAGPKGAPGKCLGHCWKAQLGLSLNLQIFSKSYIEILKMFMKTYWTYTTQARCHQPQRLCPNLEMSLCNNLTDCEGRRII
jgi:hypothetical protein